MRIAFLGLRSAFDFYQLGGCESFVRRLALRLAAENEMVDYVMFGSAKAETSILVDKIRLRYFRTCEEALAELPTQYDHVITLYIPPRDRIKYLRLRLREANNSKFHLVVFGFPDSLLRKLSLFVDLRYYNGRVFVISPRLHTLVRRWNAGTVLLLPPVPENYFLPLSTKTNHERIRITFAGRVDPGKGIEQVIDTFKQLKAIDETMEMQIFGYHWGYSTSSTLLHERLKAQTEIRYVSSSFDSYSLDSESQMRNVLKETDVLLLPYQRLNSTIDLPMLILEGMASLCAIMTPRMGDIPLIYGESDFLLDDPSNWNETKRLFEVLRFKLPHERERIFEQNRSLNFRLEQIVSQFNTALLSRKQL